MAAATAAAAEPEKITLRVRLSDDKVLLMKMFPAKKLLKLMKTFAEHMQLDQEALVFEFDGVTIVETDTPNQLGMTDRDNIDVRKREAPLCPRKATCSKPDGHPGSCDAKRPKAAAKPQPAKAPAKKGKTEEVTTDKVMMGPNQK